MLLLALNITVEGHGLRAATSPLSTHNFTTSADLYDNMVEKNKIIMYIKLHAICSRLIKESIVYEDKSF